MRRTTSADALQLVVDGRLQGTFAAIGDLEWSTCWPGGSDSLTFSTSSYQRLHPRARVDLYYGGEPVWAGVMLDPKRGEPIACEGLYRLGEDAVGIVNASGAVATGTHQAVSEAIDRDALPGWKKGWIDYFAFQPNEPYLSYDLSPVSFTQGIPDWNNTEFHSIAQWLDASALRRSRDWGVDPYGYPKMTTWPGASLHMLPGINGLARSRDGYVSAIYTRFIDSGAGNTNGLMWAQDVGAMARWGRVERTLSGLLANGQPMSATAAQAILNGLFAQGMGGMAWSSSLEVEYGDVLNNQGQPVALESIAAGQVIRLHGLVDNIADTSGSTFTDVRIGRVLHPPHASTITIEPRKMADPFAAALTAATKPFQSETLSA